MRCAIGSDEVGPLTEALLAELRRRDIAVERFGALRDVQDPPEGFASIGRAVGEAVASGAADVGIVCCWTGTGVSIAANKVNGIRAALCADVATAQGARRWNDANVLALSLRATAPAVGCEILDAFFAAAASSDPSDRSQIELL
jgi:ribose 5-phosphate isomerase B